jgi:hypothetical protein
MAQANPLPRIGLRGLDGARLIQRVMGGRQIEAPLPGTNGRLRLDGAYVIALRKWETKS